MRSLTLFMIICRGNLTSSGNWCCDGLTCVDYKYYAQCMEVTPYSELGYAYSAVSNVGAALLGVAVLSMLFYIVKNIMISLSTNGTYARVSFEDTPLTSEMASTRSTYQEC